MTPEELRRFDEASNHPYECGCELCKDWWTQAPPEDDGPEDEPYCECQHEPSEDEGVDNICDCCGKPLT